MEKVNQYNYKDHITKPIFSKTAVFSEETVKNRSGGAFDHFLGKGGFQDKKLIQPFLSRIK